MDGLAVACEGPGTADSSAAAYDGAAPHPAKSKIISDQLTAALARYVD